MAPYYNIMPYSNIYKREGIMFIGYGACLVVEKLDFH